MRLIDADALLDDIRLHSASYFADDFAREWVDKQPTINAESKWIPCSERLPKKSDRGFIVSVAKKYRWLGYSIILIHESSVLIDGYKDGFYEAWQQLPKPFEVEE